jgi:ribonuclease-3
LARPTSTPPDPATLAERLGHVFQDPALLIQALSHRSWCAESDGQLSNERLEFLGDAVLGLVVADYCYRHYPELPEGGLAKVRAAVVNTGVLAEIGEELGVGQVLRLGRGEEVSGGRAKPSLLADAVEAVIGATYLDGGWGPCAALVLRILGPRISGAAAGPGASDYKTRLQEYVVRRSGELPTYSVVGEGPDHARRYSAELRVGGTVVGRGSGRSKKDAEQDAAQAAWQVLVAQERDGGRESAAPDGGLGHDA